jgi:hypothetical protein
MKNGRKNFITKIPKNRKSRNQENLYKRPQTFSNIQNSIVESIIVGGVPEFLISDGKNIKIHHDSGAVP